MDSSTACTSAPPTEPLAPTLPSPSPPSDQQQQQGEAHQPHPAQHLHTQQPAAPENAQSAPCPSPPLRRDAHLAFENSGRPFPCTLTSCDGSRPLPASVKEAILKVNLIQAAWGNRKDINVLSVLYVAHGGGPVVQALPMQGEAHDSAFETQHKECLEDHTALVIRLGEAHELLLAPVTVTQDDGSKAPVFWGFVLCPGMASIACGLLERAQLALVFDLDETLIVAQTSSTVEARRDDCLRAHDHFATAAANASAPDEKAQLQTTACCLQKEAELLSFDGDLLAQYGSSNTVRIQGRLFTPRPEMVTLEDGTPVQRPVIRLKESQVILTRINPADRKSSVIIRIRPGWKELCSFLGGGADAKQRFDVYVCTAAERRYAFEVWRLLDPSGTLIPPHLRTQRIVNVAAGRLKTLPNTVGLMPHGEEAPASGLSAAGGMGTASGTAEGSAPEPAYAEAARQLPLGVIVDDRTVVWEPPCQSHVLQVMPWTHYRDEAARLLRVDTHTSAASERELMRVRNAIVQLRGDVYQSVQQHVLPRLDEFAAQGVPQALQHAVSSGGDLSQHLPDMVSTARLLQDPRWATTYGMPTATTPLYEPPPALAAASAPPPPAQPTAPAQAPAAPPTGAAAAAAAGASAQAAGPTPSAASDTAPPAPQQQQHHHHHQAPTGLSSATQQPPTASAGTAQPSATAQQQQQQQQQQPQQQAKQAGPSGPGAAQASAQAAAKPSMGPPKPAAKPPSNPPHAVRASPSWRPTPCDQERVRMELGGADGCGCWRGGGGRRRWEGG